MKLLLGFAIAVIACSKPAAVAAPPQAPTAGTTDAAGTTDVQASSPPATTPTPAPTPVTGCIVSPADQQACVAKGAGFAYGPPPFIFCSGVRQDVRALAQQHAKAQEKQPCVCNNNEAIALRRQECAMVP